LEQSPLVGGGAVAGLRRITLREIDEPNLIGAERLRCHRFDDLAADGLRGAVPREREQTKCGEGSG